MEKANEDRNLIKELVLRTNGVSDIKDIPIKLREPACELAENIANLLFEYNEKYLTDEYWGSK